MGNLAAAQTTGHIRKLVILRSYSHMAREIHNLQLPTFEIPGLFRANKLSPLLGGSTPSRQYSPLPPAFNQLDLQSQYASSDSSRPPSSPKKQYIKPSRTQSVDFASGSKSKTKRTFCPSFSLRSLKCSLKVTPPLATSNT
jgi:hypothetical protein